MGVRFRDYYEILGVARGADRKEIQKAYRRQARKLHPDVNKAADATDRFKELNEAYEVLSDPQKRSLYDSLGANWKQGQDFRPPPGFDGFGGAASGRRGQPGARPGAQPGAAFSDFFESLFGGLGGMGTMGGFSFDQGAGPSSARRPSRRRSSGGGGFSGFPGFEGFEGFEGQQGGAPHQARGQDVEGSLEVTLEEVTRGAQRKVTLQSADGSERVYDVRIPQGIGDGQRIRLSGQGGDGHGGGTAGDLYLRIHYAPHPVFKVDGTALTVEVAVAPWEAVLGAKVEVPTLEGPVLLTLAPGTQGGQKLRLRGKGLPGRERDGARGDLFAVVRIVVPKVPTEDERALFVKLQAVSRFQPRRPGAA